MENSSLLPSKDIGFNSDNQLHHNFYFPTSNLYKLMSGPPQEFFPDEVPMQITGRKTSKRVLNMNAIKFKLTKLRSTTIRYEVIYKNLLRDLRKYFSQDFNSTTDYIRKKKGDLRSYTTFLNEYVDARFDNSLLVELSVTRQELVFSLGSLIYPKEMLRVLGHQMQQKQRVI